MMSAELQIALDVVALAIGFGLILWGFRIYRLWIALSGAATGAALGVALAMLATGSMDTIVLSAAAGALLGALMAWPFQKAAVFITAGVATGLLGVLSLQAWAGPDQVAAIASAVVATLGFLAGGMLAVRLFEPAVTLAMAFAGALVVFHAVFVPADTWAGDAAAILNRIVGVYTARLPAFVATAALFLGLALWLQSGRRRRKQSRGSLRDALGRRIAVRFAALILVAWTAAALLGVSRGWQVSSFELIGMHPLSWPVVTLAAVTLAGLPRFSPRAPHIPPFPPDTPPNGRSLIYAWVAFGLFAMPALTAAVFATFGAPWDAIVGFYRAFALGPAASIATKYGVSLALLPLALASAVRSASREHAERAAVALETDETPDARDAEPEDIDGDPLARTQPGAAMAPADPQVTQPGAPAPRCGDPVVTQPGTPTPRYTDPAVTQPGLERALVTTQPLKDVRASKII